MNAIENGCISKFIRIEYRTATSIQFHHIPSSALDIRFVCSLKRQVDVDVDVELDKGSLYFD